MYYSLKQRIEDLEKILGINEDNASETFVLDIVSIRNKLKELNLEYVLNMPVNKLHRLKKAFSDGVDVPLKDKIRSINFSSGLLRKRAYLLEELQKTSDIVFESDKFAQISELTWKLDQVEADAIEAINAISKFDAEFNEFHEDLSIVLSDLYSKLEEVEKRLKVIENPYKK